MGLETHFSFFTMISCKISWGNPGGISPALLHEILCFTIKLTDCAFTSHFSPAFLQVIFIFSMRFLHSGNFSMKQEMCVFVFTGTECQSYAICGMTCRPSPGCSLWSSLVWVCSVLLKLECPWIFSTFQNNLRIICQLCAIA